MHKLYHMASEKIKITLPDGLRIHCEYYPAASELVCVNVHGFRSSVAHHKARFFRQHASENNYSWVHFDLPCHGMSQGAFREFRMSKAMAALYEVVSFFAGKPLLLLGSSLGGWLTAAAVREFGGEANIKAAVLLAPAFDFINHYFIDNPDISTQQELQRWKEAGVRDFYDHYDEQNYQLEYDVIADGLQYNLLNAPGEFNFPITIFHGDQDEIIPLRLSERFVAKAKVEGRVGGADLRVIKNADHSLEPHWGLIAERIDEIYKN